MLTMNNQLSIGVFSDEMATEHPEVLVDEYMTVLNELAKKYT